MHLVIMFGFETLTFKDPIKFGYCNAPILADTETLLQRIYASQKYLHVYTLSISTGKNQSTEISGALYIPTHEYNYKVITRGDPILHEYYITDMCNCEITKICTCMNSTKTGSES